MGHCTNKLLKLPDTTRVFPAHGAGSSCGKQLSSETSSTIGEQRQTNYALKTIDVDQFVAAVTEGQPVRPRYFEFAAHRNRELRPLLDENPLPLLDIDDVCKHAQAGAILLDSREPADYACDGICAARSTLACRDASPNGPAMFYHRTATSCWSAMSRWRVNPRSACPAWGSIGSLANYATSQRFSHNDRISLRRLHG